LACRQSPIAGVDVIVVFHRDAWANGSHAHGLAAD